MNSSATLHDESRVTLGCFDVSGAHYAFDVTQMREVVRWQPVTPLPKAPDLIEGVIDLRGVVVPVVDLGRALGGPPIEESPSARIAIVEIDGLVMGLAVDAAVEVMSVDVEEEASSASGGGSACTPWTTMWRGKKIEKLVPLPISESTVMKPPVCLTMP